MSTGYELVILGQGSAAFAAAIKANDLGVKTAMVGSNATKGTVVGGTCVNVGCVPSKRLITVGTLFHDASDNSFEGIHYGKGKLNFRQVIQQKDELVRRFRREKYANVLKNLKQVTYYKGLGRFVSKNEVKVRDKTLTADKFLIATGARPNLPKVKGIEKIDYLTNEEALSLTELPESMCVVGGRALGLEFAQMYAQLGTDVTVLQRSVRILPDGEPEVSDVLTEHLEERGITIHTDVTLNWVGEKGNRKIINAYVDGKVFNVTCEQLLFATGRTPNTNHLDLPNAGVKTDEHGFVVVNDEMQTSAPHVWAAGDVIGEPMLETIAAKEGAVAVGNAFGQEKKKIAFNEVPSAVFTYPEVASVGLTEAQAEERGIKCSCTILPLDTVPKARIIGETRGVVKLVINRETKQILGLHMVAPHAADLIHEGVLAVKFKLSIDNIIDTVHVFPTLSEGVKLAAQSFYKDVGQLSCCTE
ncbi:MAG TPA: mercury(II) reductase [Candidatus Bathyarchaeia archaeon]|nr:mercury(II) reductase [Candidatus Bathyarchaeia archaeon]